MADRNPSSPSADEGSPGSLTSFDLEEDEGDEPRRSEEATQSEERWLSQTAWTYVAIALALAVGVGTILTAQSIVQGAGADVALSELIVVGLIAIAIGAAAYVPLRWGLWVVPFVATAHYALNFYNMLFTDQSIYGFVPGSAVGYAVFTPAIGVVLGWVLQGVYSMVAP